MSTEARSRAAEALGVPADAPADAVTAAFLASLPVAGFVPSGSTVAALNTLAGTVLPADGDSNLRAEVEEFAGAPDRRILRKRPSQARPAVVNPHPSIARTPLHLSGTLPNTTRAIAQLRAKASG